MLTKEKLVTPLKFDQEILRKIKYEKKAVVKWLLAVYAEESGKASSCIMGSRWNFCKPF